AGCGAVFELQPPIAGLTTWTEKPVFRFVASTASGHPAFVTPLGRNLFGMGGLDALGDTPFVFKLSFLSRRWIETTEPLGGNPSDDLAPLILDFPVTGNRTFYGGIPYGGSSGAGVIFSWTP